MRHRAEAGKNVKCMPPIGHLHYRNFMLCPILLGRLDAKEMPAELHIMNGCQQDAAVIQTPQFAWYFGQRPIHAHVQALVRSAM